MATNAHLLLLIFFVVGSGALGYQLDIPDALRSAKSPLEESSAKFLKSLVEKGLILNNPEVCGSLGFFCAEEISSAPEPVPKRSLGARKSLDLNAPKQQSINVDEPPMWVNEQPFGVGPEWRLVNKQPFGVGSEWRLLDKQPFGVGSEWRLLNKHPFGAGSEWRLVNQPSKQEKAMLESPRTKGRAFRFASSQAGKSILLPPITAFLSNKLIHPHLQDALPFTMESLPQVLRTFNLPADSEMARVMEFSLGKRKASEDDVEIRKPATTTEEMFDFVGKLLCKGKAADCHIKSITQSFENKDSKMVKVESIELLSEDSVACHTVPFPYKVYICHKIKDSPVYKMNMMLPGDKTATSAPVMCHWDTSAFRPDHPAFEDLNMKPGEGEICHWLAYETIVWYV